MSNATELAAVKVAIAEAQKAQEFSHGSDTVKRADLQTLLTREAKLQSLVNRRGRGPRSIRCRIGHGG